jgi:hypothetical protein
MCHLLPVHQSGAGVQQKVRFAARRRRAFEQIEIGPAKLGGLKGLAVAIVTAEHDNVMVGARVEDPKGVRQIGEKGAVAPGVERVPVAADKPDVGLDFGLQRGRERRQLQVTRGGNVEDQLGQAAGRGDDTEPPPGRASCALGSGDQLGKFDQVRDLDRVMGAKEL